MTLTEKEKLIAELAVKIWLSGGTKKDAVDRAAEFIKLAHDKVNSR